MLVGAARLLTTVPVGRGREGGRGGSAAVAGRGRGGSAAVTGRGREGSAAVTGGTGGWDEGVPPSPPQTPDPGCLGRAPCRGGVTFQGGRGG